MDDYCETQWSRCMFCGREANAGGKACYAGDCQAKLRRTPMRVLNGIVTERVLACFRATCAGGQVLDFYYHGSPRK